MAHYPDSFFYSFHKLSDADDTEPLTCSKINDPEFQSITATNNVIQLGGTIYTIPAQSWIASELVTKLNSLTTGYTWSFDNNKFTISSANNAPIVIGTETTTETALGIRKGTYNSPYTPKWDNGTNSSGMRYCSITSDNSCKQEYVNAMCDNKELSDKLQGYVQNSNGENERYINTSSKYNTQVLDSFNLGIGVLLGAILLYKI